MDLWRFRDQFAIVSLLTIGIYMWKKYFDIRNRYAQDLKEKQLWEKLHNTVVIYSRNRGICGWPLFETDDYICKELSRAFDPIIHFINTTQESLNIAIMVISSSTITNAILAVKQRGVKVKIILNFEHSNNSCIQKLIQNGVDVVFFIGLPKEHSIFHYKYAVKDYDTEFSAAYCGSINWTDNAFLSNYEDMMFTTNKSVIDDFYQNFNTSFDCIKANNETEERIQQLRISLECN